MRNCAVDSCTKEIRKTENITRYHKFPRDEELRYKWLILCRRDDEVADCSKLVICSRHFSESDYDRDFKFELLGVPSRKFLKIDSVPSLNLMKIKEERTDAESWRHKDKQWRNKVPTLLSQEEYPKETAGIKWKKLDSRYMNNAVNRPESNHGNEHLRERNQVEQKAVPASAPLQLEVHSVASECAPTSFPASHTWPGRYGFTVSFSPQNKNTKGVVWTYSKIKDKLYVGKDAPCPVNFSTNTLVPSDAYIRVVAVYTSLEQVSEVVRRCFNHSMEEIQTGVFEAEHLIRCESSRATYTVDHTTMRHSVIVPFENPPAGQQFSTYIYKFACFGSCAGGPNRRPLMLIFTLERGNQVIGRRKIDVKICACPGRDRKAEESQCVKAENVQRVSVKIKEPNELVNLTDVLNFTKSVYCSPPKKAKLMPSRDGYYTVSAETQECYEFLLQMKKFYEACKNVSGLSPDAMKALHYNYQKKKSGGKN